MNTLVAKLHRWLLWAGLAAVSLGQLQRVFPNQASSPYVHDLLIVAWLGVFIFRVVSDGKIGKVLNARWSEIWRQLPMWIQAVVVWTGVWSLVLLSWQWVARGPDWIQLAYLGRWLTYLVFGAAVWEWSHWDSLNAKNFTRAWQWWLVLLVAFGWLQYLLLPDLRWLHVLGWDDHLYRLSGTTFDPNFTGLLLVFGWIGVWRWSELKKWSLPVQLTALGIITATVALTYSRASYLALVGVLGVLLVAKSVTKQLPSKLVVVAATCLFVAILSVFIAQAVLKPDGEGVKLTRTASITARTVSAREVTGQLHSWELVTGTGWFAQRIETATDPNGATIIDRARLPDNWVLWLLQSIGLLGSIPLLIVAVFLTGKYFRSHSVIISLLAALLIHGLFNASLTQPFVVILFGLSFTFLTQPQPSTRHS
jgi:hypothetical protein